MHFAVEEALLRLMDETDAPPMLRLRQTIPSVWIGYYQVPEEDVDVEFCKKNKIPIVRRLNSGGAVYQDKGSFCYSAFFKKSELAKWGIKQTDELYAYFGKVVVDLCKKYGIAADLSPVNDITVNGRKIYGSAQLDWYSAFVHSGSFLVNANLDLMQKVLKPSDLKFSDKGYKSVRERVINLSELSPLLKNAKFIQSEFLDIFSETFNIEWDENPLTFEEIELARKLCREKYGTKKWTFTKQTPYTRIVSIKIPGGVMKIKALLNRNMVEEVAISGDFLNPYHQILEKLLKEIKYKTVDTILKSIPNYDLPTDVSEGLIVLFKQLQQ